MKPRQLAQKIQVNFPKPDNIIVAGLGGSAIGGDLLKDWARNKTEVPIEVNREYHLPAYAGKKTLVLVSSYSGDTEETLSCFSRCPQTEMHDLSASASGGALLKYAIKHKVPYLQVPGGMPPRAALPYMFIPLLIFMEKIGLVTGVSVELEEALNLLEKISTDNLPQKPTIDNFAKTLALTIGETVPVIYGFGFYRAVAQRFKQQFNENAKSQRNGRFSLSLTITRLSVGKTAENLCKWFSVIFIRDKNEPVEIKSRIETTKEIMEQLRLKNV